MISKNKEQNANVEEKNHDSNDQNIPSTGEEGLTKLNTFVCLSVTDSKEHCREGDKV
jgi:hypothetical protein